MTTPVRSRSFVVTTTAAATSTQSIKRMTISDEAGYVRFTAPYSPQAVNHAGLAPSFADAERDGRAPLLLRAADPRPTQTFSLFLAFPDRTRSVEGGLRILREMAFRQSRIRVGYGPSESAGLWRITDLSFDSEDRNAKGEITRATVTISLTRAVDAVTNRGPLSGGAKPPAGGKPTKGRKPAPRVHTVKRGDTLAGISVKFYRTPSQWRTIADANGIRDPKKLPVGKKLKIPDLAKTPAKRAPVLVPISAHTLTAAEVARLKKQGWTSKRTDGAEMLYPPKTR